MVGHQRVTPELDRRAMRKVVAGSFAGALLEWYDFFLYGTASALVFGKVFFPEVDPLAGTAAAFATFGAGFFARPVGGLVFGHFGDRVGRKTALIWTLLIVGISTFAIGLLPTYSQVGLWAPVLLVALRLIQGFGLGGEYGGAALLTIESAPQARRGFYGSLPQTAASAGILLATGAFALVSSALPEPDFLTWGWRIPFLVSLALLVVGTFIRHRIEEPQEFAVAKAAADRTHKPDKPPLIRVLTDNPGNLFLAFGARLAETVSSNIVNAFAIAYISTQLAMNRSVPLNGLLVASAIGIAACPIIGRLSDRVGQRAIYLVGAAFVALFAFPFFLMLDTQDNAVVWLALILAYNLGPTTMFAVQPTMFTGMFGPRTRYTGLSFAYQFSAILGGLTPLIAAWLLASGDGQPWGVAGFLAVIAVISFVCVILVRPARQPRTPC